MLISRLWLQRFFDIPLPPALALADALTFHAFEIETVEGETLDVKVTPNRGHDCLSHRGIAKEISAILNISLTHDPLKKPMSGFTKSRYLNVSIENPSLCSRYIAGYIRGVKVGPSPDWLKDHLESVGQKSINNVVDAANFVMFHIGQPMHIFDARTLASKSKQKTENSEQLKILVRNAKKGEKIETLEGKEYELSDSMLVVLDANSIKPIAIAGVKGGKFAEVTEITTDIILEAANFDGVSVRKTAQALKLRTDASTRFEQILSPEMAAIGMRELVDLIKEIAGGEVEGFVDEYHRKQKNAAVLTTSKQINHILGTDINEDKISDTFTRLGFPFDIKSSVFVITPTFERLDIAIPEDLAEEVGRIIGYEKIPGIELPSLDSAVDKPQINENFYTAEHVREKLISMGYSEVYTSVFSDKGERRVANKVGGERPFLRSNLLDGLKEAVERNVFNKDVLGIKEVKLFEIGTIWDAGMEEVVVGIAGENEEASQLPLSKYRDEISEIKKFEDYPASSTKRYKSFSRFPFIVRDIALWVAGTTAAEDVEKVIKQNAGDFLVRIELFDRFEKNSKVSLAFRLVFQSFDKTLTDKEVNLLMENLYVAAKKKGWDVR